MGFAPFCRVWDLYSEYGIGVGLISEFFLGDRNGKEKEGKRHEPARAE
jgi:hypothetical protein